MSITGTPWTVSGGVMGASSCASRVPQSYRPPLPRGSSQGKLGEVAPVGSPVPREEPVGVHHRVAADEEVGQRVLAELQLRVAALAEDLLSGPRTVSTWVGADAGGCSRARPGLRDAAPSRLDRSRRIPMPSRKRSRPSCRSNSGAISE